MPINDDEKEKKKTVLKTRAEENLIRIKMLAAIQIPGALAQKEKVLDHT